jgi:hypothetical protein
MFDGQRIKNIKELGVFSLMKITVAKQRWPVVTELRVCVFLKHTLLELRIS